MKKVIYLFFSLSLVLALTACGEKEIEPKISTTIYPIEFVADYLIGDEVEVVSVLPPGADPHSYEPTPKEIQEVIESDLFIFLGLGLEAAASSIGDAIEGEEVTVLELGDVMDFSKEEHHHEGEDHDEEDHEDEEDEHDHEHYFNHHVWFDYQYMIQITELVSNQLVEVYPEHSEQIAQRATSLIEAFEAMNQMYIEQLSDLRVMRYVVSHDAFEHLDIYGIYSLPIKDETHSKNPTQKELNEIIETAKDLGISHVFYEHNVSSVSADVVANELAADKLYLHNLSTRRIEDINDDKDFFDLMEENLNALVEAMK